MCAAQGEIQQLRAKLENTEAVAHVVIGKLEAKPVARQGSSHEVAAQLQASGWSAPAADLYLTSIICSSGGLPARLVDILHYMPPRTLL